MDFSLLLPTRGRPERVAQLLESLAGTVSGRQDIEVVLRVDEDDPGSHRIHHARLRVVTITGPPRQPMGTMLDACYAASRGRWVMLLNDDAVCRTAGWDRRVRETFALFPDEIALVYGNDLDQGRHVPTFPFLSRKVCDILGGVCPRDYWNLHIESHLFDIFRRLARLGHDRIVYLDDVVFEHLHHSLGKSPADATSIKRDQTRDTQLYFELAGARQQMAERLAEEITASGRSRAVPGPRASAGRVPDGSTSLVLLLPGRLRPGRSDWLAHVVDGTTDGRVVERVVVVPKDAALPSTHLARLGIVCRETGPYETCPSLRVLSEVSKACRGEFVAYLPFGARPARGWLSAAVAALRATPGAVIAGARLLHPRNGRVVHAGIAFLEVDGRVQFSPLYRGFPAAHPAVMRSRVLQAVTPAGAVVRRAAVATRDDSVPSASSTMLAWLDLCLGFCREGGCVLYVPDAVIEYDDAEELGEALRIQGEVAWKVEPDLLRFLREDGFDLERGPHGDYVLREIGK